ncbi:MAG: hypothetical protein AVDCRST_MAG30-1217 [uncultured Solirubrobacteraceae bacterium]|uniref:Glycosyltransferase RgtA/B/C/D-like domain-containing protein n=1 Tax=uncultured Solirubrobacteraceae bacterium TaxID=1162706 RepID=A0A6J4S455_9ACTN|nr:MAG: hypothetical protein AVDCRST_MAG30-1217 [uncultured Solirubrobacteraceae bacterium]
MATARYAGVVGPAATWDVLRVLLPAVALFGVVGLGLVRLWLPDGLRRHEWLWVLPAGAVATAFAMTPLGFAYVPFEVNLGAVALGGLGLSVWAVRSRGWPGRPGAAAIGWPVYLAGLLICVALIPAFRSGFVTVIGNGSDAHLATGTAEFLRQHHPLGTAPELPVDQMPLVWRSKQAIYYALGAVATVSGVETYEAIAPLAALLLAMAAIGMYLVARDAFGAGVAAASAALLITGLSRTVLHTGMHPYFNQTWGYLTLPFLLVLTWAVVRAPTRGGAALLALFLAIAAFSYPLVLPLPVLVGAVIWWIDGKRVRGIGLPRRPAVRVGAVVLGVALLVPLVGVAEKLVSALRVLLDPDVPLQGWAGDAQGYFPERQFLAVAVERLWWIPALVIAGFAAWELRRLPRALAGGLAAVILAGLAIAIEMRLREYGYYFHFKILAFVAPLVIVLAVVGMARARAAGVVLLAVWLAWAVAEARDEVTGTFDQLPRATLELRAWDAAIPPGASVRLDMAPGHQLWAAYMLAAQPLCSARPLLATSYPHVPVSGAADYALTWKAPRPGDAVGAPVRRNGEYALFRLRSRGSDDRCSRRMVQTVTRIGL